MNKQQKILFVLSEDWYFTLHWLKLARAARDQGFCVGVATKCSNDSEEFLRGEGFQVFPLRKFSRRGMNPLREFSAIRELSQIYKDFRPDLIHHFVVKTCLIGTIAARLSRMPLILNANTGGGYIYTGNSFSLRLLRALVTQLFRIVFNSEHVHILLLNDGDREEFAKLWQVPLSRAWSILGVPLELSRFKQHPEPEAVPVVLFAGRMLRDKGLDELFSAARILKSEKLEFRLLLAGDEDPGNPASLSANELTKLQDQGLIEWLRFERDMPRLYSESHIVCLPSHREGLGAVLVEAGACGRPAIASDIPGCRDVVVNDTTGILVPARDPGALANAIRRLLSDKQLRESMGQAAKVRIDQEFALSAVINRYLNLYGKLLEHSATAVNGSSRNQADTAARACC